RSSKTFAPLFAAGAKKRRQRRSRAPSRIEWRLHFDSPPERPSASLRLGGRRRNGSRRGPRLALEPPAASQLLEHLIETLLLRGGAVGRGDPLKIIVLLILGARAKRLHQAALRERRAHVAGHR